MVMGIENDEFIHFTLMSATRLYFIYEFGFIYGILAIIAFNYAYHYIMSFVFGLVALGPMDEIFLHDDANNPCNIVGCFIYEKYDYEEFKA